MFLCCWRLAKKHRERRRLILWGLLAFSTQLNYNWDRGSCNVCILLSLLFVGVFPQTNEHPNPGKKFSARGFPRHCYLPDNDKGRKVSGSVTMAQNTSLVWNLSFLLLYYRRAASSCVSPGPEAADNSVGPTPDLHHRHIQHHGGVGHGCVERDSPQDRIWLQPDRPRLPRPQLPGQRFDGAVGSGGRRGQPEGLMFSGVGRWDGRMEKKQTNINPQLLSLHPKSSDECMMWGQICSLYSPLTRKEKHPAESDGWRAKDKG